MAERLGQVRRIALDTEFERSKTFYPTLALLQIRTAAQTFLVDPLQVDIRPLAGVVAAQEILMHGSSEDLEVLSLAMDVLPGRLADSQVAAALTGLGEQTGYQAAVEKTLGIGLDKGAQRSNWLRRPLSEAQLRYASLDVHHLEELWAQLMERAAVLGREGWVREDCERLLQIARDRNSADDYCRRIVSKSRLNGAARERLYAVCQWREKVARELDLPRNWIIPQKALTALALDGPMDDNALQRLQLLSPRQQRKFGEGILHAIASATDLPHELSANDSSLDSADRLLRKELKVFVGDRAEELGIPASVLATREEVESFVRTRMLPERWQGWRLQAFAQDAQKRFG